MEVLLQGKEAFGHPEMPPLWTRDPYQSVTALLMKRLERERDNEEEGG